MASSSRPAEHNPTPLEAVLRRLGGSAAFPSLSTTISDINRVVGGEWHNAQQLTQVILKDVSLTSMLLQVVNSATYSQFSGGIRTVSKAVLILGTEAIRNAAMMLMMLAFSKGRPQERSLQDELIGAFFAGVVAKAVCRRIGMPNCEEAVIAAMCQSLGRLLVIFFLYDESRQVKAFMQAGMSEEQAATQVLGLTYRELGVGVARHWNFPKNLVEGMQVLAPRDIAPPSTEGESLKLAANLANDLYLTALRTPQADKAAALQALSRRYGSAIKLDPEELLETLQEGLKEIAERATALDLPAGTSAVLSSVRTWAGVPAASAGSAESGAEAGAASIGDALAQDLAVPDSVETGKSAEVNRQQVLSAGIRDITETLATDFSLDDVLRMALETMYRLGFTRTLIFLRDAGGKTMSARFGFGAEVERVIPQSKFSLAFVPDVFHVALEKGVDIVIEDTQAENVVQRIPEWHRRATAAKSFLVLPLVVKKQAVGLLYADSDRAEGIRINSEQLDLLRTLRTQVVLAFRTASSPNRA